MPEERESGRNWSLEELRVLAAIFFNSNFSIGDDAHDECRVMADCFQRTPSSVDRQWRNLDAVRKGKTDVNVGHLVKKVVADYLADPKASRSLAEAICASQGWPLEGFIRGEEVQRLASTESLGNGAMTDALLRLAEGLEYKYFSTGSQGFFRQSKITLPGGSRYQAQITAVLIGSKENMSVNVSTRPADLCNAIRPLILEVAEKTFKTGRKGYYGNGKTKVGNEKFQVAIQAVEIGGM